MAIFLKKKNGARSTLVSTIDSAATSIVVADATKFPTTAAFIVVIWDHVRYPNPSDDINQEVLLVTNVSGSTFTVVRGQEDTIGKAHSANHAVMIPITAGTFEEIENAINSTPGFVTYEKFVFTATQGQTEFILAHEPIEILSLAKNRFVLCETEDYTVSNSTITLLEGADDGDKIFGIFIY